MATVAKFEIEYRQLLDAQGNPTRKGLPKFAGDPDTLIPLYELMVRTRVFDAKAIALQRTGKLGTYASSLGHEAIHVAISSAMAPEDVFCPMYREYGAQFYRGVEMEDVLGYWGGDERGNDYSVPKHDFPWSVPIATQTLHAAGSALAFKLRGEKRAAVTVIGDGGSSKGDFLEAMNAAGVWDLPVVFVIVNNQWAISIPRAKQCGAETLAQKGIGAGITALQIDGNDLLVCKQVMSEALQRARKGKGATLIEAITYRLHDHTTADDASRYREKQEVDDAWAREPILRLRNYLTNTLKCWDDDKEAKLQQRCEKEVAAAVDHYLNSKAMPVNAMFDHLYANVPPDLERQMKQAMGDQ